MTGDGLVRPLNAPPGGTPGLGVQPGVSTGVVIANKVIVAGPGGSIFVYSGIPAAGNLVLADVAVNTTDQFGNQVFAGLNILRPLSAGQARLCNIAGGPGQNTGIQWYYSTVGQHNWQKGAAIAPQVATQLVMFTDALTIVPATSGIVPTVAAQMTLNGASFIPPSGDTTGAADAAAINTAVTLLPAGGGTIILGPGQWYLLPGAVTISVAKPVWIMAHGAFISTVAGISGDVIRWFDSTNPVGRAYFGGGWIGGIIDGTNAGAGTTAFHFGDVEAAVIRDLTIQNFSGAGSRSLRLDNSLWWTEEADMRVVVVNCPGPTFEVTQGFKSFGYGNFDFTVISNVNLNGVQILNGAFLYHGALRMRGNFFGNTVAVTNFAFGMSGVAPVGGPNAGATSLMQAMRFEMQVECSTAAFTPRSIVMDSVNFAFANENYGIIDISNGSGTFANATIAVGQFIFTGMVNANGDAGLSPVQGYWSNISAPVIYRRIVNFFQAVFPTPLADMFRTTLAGNWTVALTAAGINGNQTLPYPQRVTIVIQQSAGGANTVTWPHPGVPSVSTPTVLWPGGVAPVMTAAANAVDVYDLETQDGITWYGRALQNVS